VASRRRRQSLSAARTVADTTVPLRDATSPDKVFAPPAKKKITGVQGKTVTVVSAERLTGQDNTLKDVINRVARGQATAGKRLVPAISYTVSTTSEQPTETISTNEIIQAV